MSENLFNKVYNPDVLSCLANLSNDEVFTPPEIVNQMLDMLPQELFRNPDTTFLDPACKTGIFLREIAKRLIKGLEPQFPDLQERIDHIFHKQLFGIAITELTSLLSRRGIYCSKYPNSDFSVTKFDTAQGNIRFKRIDHTWVNGRCKYCGANKENYDRGEELETHAYEFIHTDNLEKLFNMKFDVIIGNPPYQMSLGNEGGNASKANAIYHLFVEKAKKLKPSYLSMIIPSRWMTRSAEGVPDSWVTEMITENKLVEMHDYLEASECFPGIDIGGGVCYFLWDRNYNGKCKFYAHANGVQTMFFDYLDSKNSGIVIRDAQAHSIINKIEVMHGNYYLKENDNFAHIVSPKNYFSNTTLLTSSWKGFVLEKDNIHNIRYYCSKNMCKNPCCYIKLSDIPRNQDGVANNKVYISAAYGERGNGPYLIIGKPFIGEKQSCCSQTYLIIGYNKNYTEQECENIISYVKTKFFRYLVGIKKKTQNGPKGVYQFVPLQDFSKPWTDEELYAKYGLTQEEIDFIESMIRPME